MDLLKNMVYYLPNNMVIKDMVSQKNRLDALLGGCWRFTFWLMLMDIAQMDIAQIHLTMKLLLRV